MYDKTWKENGKGQEEEEEEQQDYSHTLGWQSGRQTLRNSDVYISAADLPCLFWLDLGHHSHRHWHLKMWSFLDKRSSVYIQPTHTHPYARNHLQTNYNAPKLCKCCVNSCEIIVLREWDLKKSLYMFRYISSHSFNLQGFAPQMYTTTTTLTHWMKHNAVIKTTKKKRETFVTVSRGCDCRRAYGLIRSLSHIPTELSGGRVLSSTGHNPVGWSRYECVNMSLHKKKPKMISQTFFWR